MDFFQKHSDSALSLRYETKAKNLSNFVQILFTTYSTAYEKSLIFLEIFLSKNLVVSQKSYNFALAIGNQTPMQTKRPSNGAVVQLVRIHACHAWGRGFESRPHRRGERKSNRVNLGFLLLFFRYSSLSSDKLNYPVKRADMKYIIINGPNLNILGRRLPDIYGDKTFEDTLSEIRSDFKDYEILYFQSNSEGEIIDAIQRFGFDENTGGIIINPGAYAHYSLAIADAIESVPVPVMEVHISNIHSREEFRQTSVTARAARGVIAGCGRDGYALALLHLIRIANNTETQSEN